MLLSQNNHDHNYLLTLKTIVEYFLFTAAVQEKFKNGF